MKITDIITSPKPSLSFEVFPPKTSDNFESVMQATEAIAELEPSFMSVTYGAGGGTSLYTAEIASRLLQKNVTPIAHLSCISSTKEQIHTLLADLKQRGIQNILALRGDIPQGMTIENPQYRYASELTAEIRSFGSFCIGGACYPESHPESKDGKSDIESLKIKVESGCEFLTTQMFFDNDILYNFMYRLLKAGVNVPVIAGIMPVTNAKQIKRIISISQNALPQRFVRLVDRYGDNPLAMRQAGIAYATEQIIDLYANGVNAVHVYSMNNPFVAQSIRNNLSEILK
ncbi:MAG: methylenetetrahydrofolate reductase [NAD(P)H] [Clostridia bacterium]|nr:methylenetetrahydrofolate reductase [NAD(P)H] [Clostridia bacterium]